MSTTSPSRPPASPAPQDPPPSPTTDSPDATTTAGPRVHRERRGAVAGALVALAFVVGLVLTAFTLPAVKAAPRDVPIGIAGPAAATAQVSGALASRAPGAFAVTSYPDEAALTAAIRDRDVYGGFVVTQNGPKVVTAPAGSPAVAQLLGNIATGLSQQTGTQIPVAEAVPLPTGDPRGAGLVSALLPLLIGSVAPVVAMIRLVRGRWARLVGVLASSVVLGATLAALLHAYGVMEHDWWLDAAAMTAVIAAMSTTLLGLFTVARWPGFGFGVALFVLVGNPLSGFATAPEFLPAFWSTLGAWLPPGAAGQLLRSAAYFDGAGAAGPLLVLASWFALGLVLVAVGRRGQDSAMSVGARGLDAVPA